MTREEAISLIKSAQLMLINPTTNEPVSDLYEALEMAISALEQNESAEEWYKLFVEKLEQEPNRDIKEIAEIMKCDADAETKCKMISSILTAKPHYFELSQESIFEKDPCETCGYAEGKQLEPCEDAISRADMYEEIEDWLNLSRYYHPKSKNNKMPIDELRARIDRLPSVQPSRKVIEDIRAEIEREADYQDAYVDADVAKGMYSALEIIDKHIEGR